MFFPPLLHYRILLFNLDLVDRDACKRINSTLSILYVLLYLLKQVAMKTSVSLASVYRLEAENWVDKKIS